MLKIANVSCNEQSKTEQQLNYAAPPHKRRWFTVWFVNYTAHHAQTIIHVIQQSLHHPKKDDPFLPHDSNIKKCHAIPDYDLPWVLQVLPGLYLHYGPWPLCLFPFSAYRCWQWWWFLGLFSHLGAVFLQPLHLLVNLFFPFFAPDLLGSKNAWCCGAACIGGGHQCTGVPICLDLALLHCLLPCVASFQHLLPASGILGVDASLWVPNWATLTLTWRLRLLKALEWPLGCQTEAMTDLAVGIFGQVSGKCWIMIFCMAQMTEMWPLPPPLKKHKTCTFLPGGSFCPICLAASGHCFIAAFCHPYSGSYSLRLSLLSVATIIYCLLSLSLVCASVSECVSVCICSGPG